LEVLLYCAYHLQRFCRPFSCETNALPAFSRGCVVFGRVAGDSASAYLFKEISKNGGGGGSSGAVSRLNQVNGHLSLPSTTISVDPNSQQVFLTINYGQGAGASSSSSSSSAATSDDGIKANGPSTAEEPANEKEAATPPKEQKGTKKEYTMEEVAKHNKKDDLWVSFFPFTRCLSPLFFR